MNKGEIIMKLGERMKLYEEVPKVKLMRKIPVILRLDGKTFHTYTRGFEKPWDKYLNTAMTQTAAFVCDNVSGAKLAYTQSDEISILITDYENIETQPWFDYQVEKIVSVAASMATAKFNEIILQDYKLDKKLAFFDCRAANYPKGEVINYFIWRQQDAERNSVQGLAQSLFSHKELQGLKNNQLQDKMFTEKGINWNECETWQKRGTCIIKENYEKEGAIRSRWVADMDIPIFTQDREYISRFI
jgi:tRNA(His) 5'-end guanylyltransferase